MNEEQKKSPMYSAMSMVEEREIELQNLKNAIFRYWDRFGGAINGIFLKVFPVKDSIMDMMILSKWLLEWNGGMEVFVSKIREILNKKFNIRESDIELVTGGYDFNFKIIGIDRVNKSDYQSSITVNAVVYGDGTIRYILDEPDNDGNPVTHTLNQALETENAWEIRTEIKDLVEEWLHKTFVEKFGVKIYINHLDII